MLEVLASAALCWNHHAGAFGRSGRCRNSINGTMTWWPYEGLALPCCEAGTLGLGWFGINPQGHRVFLMSRWVVPHKILGWFRFLAFVITRPIQPSIEAVFLWHKLHVMCILIILEWQSPQVTVQDWPMGKGSAKDDFGTECFLRMVPFPHFLRICVSGPMFGNTTKQCFDRTWLEFPWDFHAGTGMFAQRGPFFRIPKSRYSPAPSF